MTTPPPDSHPTMPTLLHAFFRRAVARWPDLVAVEIPPGSGRPERRQVSYAELDRRSEAIAAALQPLVSGECVVAVLLPRDSEALYAAQLGALRAGAAYACIDPGFPDGQVADILLDSEAVALLTDAQGLARARAAAWTAAPTFEVQGLMREEVRPVPPERAPWLGPHSLAYLIYTSGTTGRPKGVEIEHRGIASLVASDLAEFCLGPGDRVAQGSSSAYDSSVEENWLALAAGATLVVMDDEAVRLGPDLVPWLRREHISVLCPPPTLLRTTGCHDPHRELPDLKLVYVGGEALPRDVAEAWSPGLRLENGYGPTECTVTCLRTRILPGEAITIGRPVPGMQAFVLDEQLEPVPEGMKGELCMGGPGLARGYRKRPELSAQKFPEHPRLGRIYRTGDLVHRDPEGRLAYHGRLDAQVKLRGYRIELEAIEARLAECPGVREAACTVQGEEPRRSLAAFVVPEDPLAPPAEADLKAFLAAALPAYMVPAGLAFLEALPKSVGGKLDRARLPLLGEEEGGASDFLAPQGSLEVAVAAAFRRVLPGSGPLSAQADFFTDLGGDSLAAAMVVSLLREDPATAGLTVRDIYEARTVAALALRAATLGASAAPAPAGAPIPAGRPLLVTCLQVLWLLLGLALVAPTAWALAFLLLPRLTHQLGLPVFLLVSPLLLMGGAALYALLATLLTLAMKALLIGHYRPLRVPAWSGFHLRHWMVVQVARLIPWRLLEGTGFQVAVLRALGARIGSRVHLHRGVNLAQGGWDLLEIGDDATLGLEAALRLVDVDAGHLVVGPVRLGPGSALEVRAGLGPDTTLGAEAILGPLSSLPAGGSIPEGQRWEGVPARFTAYVPPPAPLPGTARELRPATYGAALLGAEVLLALLVALPGEGLFIAAAWLGGLDGERALALLYGWDLSWRGVLLTALLVLASGPLTVATMALACRLMGRVKEGILPRWSLAYLRVWLKSGLVNAAGDWLSGTLFWPVWLRAAGMQVGQGCEISTILDVVPELVRIGPESFFADGIYLGGPRIGRGRVFVGAVGLGANTFLGNHVVIPPGEQLPEDLLVGVSTVAQDPRIRPGTSWFGHPPFELPRREIVECDRALTHEPSRLRYWNRVFWEALRFSLPLLPLAIFAAWAHALALAEAALSPRAFLLLAVPLAGLASTLAFPAVVLGLKWVLLGRVKPGVHPLWSCWCSRWDFLYVVWAMFARGALGSLEGTLLLNAYLRATGMRIGKRVLLGPGFAQVVDPDMLSFGDGATVSALFQAHTFEDRVLKIDRVEIRAGATVGPGTVMLYGADVGEGAWVAPHSVIMKREVLLPGRRYEGCPTRPL